MTAEFANLVASCHSEGDGDLAKPPVCKTDCWQHQLEAYHAAFRHPAFLLALDMGCGKSKVAIDLVVNRGCKSVLIVCPKSVLGVWPREFDKHCSVPHRLVLLKGTSRGKTRSLQQLIYAGPEFLTAVIVNYDSLWRQPLATVALNHWWDAVILDESHRIKSHRSKVSRFCAKLGFRAAYRLCLTGTPMPHSPLDAFGQFRFLDSRMFGRYFSAFRQRYAVCGIPTIPQAVTGYQNLDELAEKIAPYIFRVDKSVLDLPPVQHHVRTCQLSATGRKHYRELEREWITEIESGIVTASNALVRSIRLRQAVSGFLQDDDSKEITKIDTAKESLLEELLEDIGDMPVIVFCTFRHDLTRIAEVARRLGRRYGELSGATKNLTETAELPPDIDVLGCQIQAGSLGVDLTGSKNEDPCRYVIYYDHPWSLGEYDQSLARVHRPGQRHTVNYYHLVAEKTIDEKVLAALEKKRNVIEELLTHTEVVKCLPNW